MIRKYILKKILKTFVLIAIIFNSLYLIKMVVEEAWLLRGLSGHGELYGTLWLSIIPQLLISTVPFSFLIAVYINIYRMSISSEIVALRSFGYSIFFLFRTLLYLIIPLIFVFILLYSYIGPWSIKLFEEKKVEFLLKSITKNIQPDKINNFDDKIFLFEKNEDNALVNFILTDAKPTKETMIFHSEKLYLSDEASDEGVIKFKFDRGEFLFPNEGEELTSLQFNEMEIPLDRKFDFFGDINFNRLKTQDKDSIDYLRRIHRRELDMNQLVKVMSSFPSDSEEYYQYSWEIYFRLFISTGVILLALFAIPMGNVNPRSPNVWNPLFFLFKLISFYIFLILMQALIVRGIVHPITLFIYPVFTIWLSIRLIKKQEATT